MLALAVVAIIVISAFLPIPIAFYHAFLGLETLQATPFFSHAEPSTSFAHFSVSTITTVGYATSRPSHRSDAVTGEES